MPNLDGSLTEAERQAIRQRVTDALTPLLTGVMPRDYAFICGTHLIATGLAIAEACGVSRAELLQWLIDADKTPPGAQN